MKTTPIDNNLYRRLGHAWWDEDVGELATIRFFVNPVRFDFFERVLTRECTMPRDKQTLLDVGCGGGFLAEEFANIGLHVSGIDPSPETIATAKEHASISGLSIEYRTGVGENLPYPENSFDCVACCDVLEHVDDLNRVIEEIARVLKPGGLFLYDTINRTFMSKIAVIKAMQEWSLTAFAQSNLHSWKKFIKPTELGTLLKSFGLEQREMRGISLGCNPFSALVNLHRSVRGKITYKELGQRLAFRESSDLSVSYMGYAMKT